MHFLFQSLSGLEGIVRVSVVESLCGKFSEHSEVLVEVSGEGFFILWGIPLEVPGAAFAEGLRLGDEGWCCGKF